MVRGSSLLCAALIGGASAQTWTGLAQTFTYTDGTACSAGQSSVAVSDTNAIIRMDASNSCAEQTTAATGAKYACGSRSSRRNVLFNRALATLRAVAATAEWRPPTDALRAAAFAKAEALLVDALGDFVAAFPEDEQGESFRTVLNAPRYRRQLEAKRRKRSDEDTATGAAV